MNTLSKLTLTLLLSLSLFGGTSALADTIPDYVLKGILKVEGSGINTKWNKGNPKYHSYGAGQLTCLAMQDLGYKIKCGRGNTYLVKDVPKVEKWLGGQKGIDHTVKYLLLLKKRHKIKSWGELVRAYNQGHAGRNNRRAYIYQHKTGVK